MNPDEPDALTPQPQMRAQKNARTQRRKSDERCFKTRQRKAPAEKIRVLIADDHVTCAKDGTMIGRNRT